MNPSVIIDVRSPQEFSNGHIEGALNIPYEHIVQGVISLEGIEKTSEILLYCLSGARSGVARSLLEQHGYCRAVNGGALATLALNFNVVRTA